MPLSSVLATHRIPTNSLRWVLHSLLNEVVRASGSPTHFPFLQRTHFLSAPLAQAESQNSFGYQAVGLILRLIYVVTNERKTCFQLPQDLPAPSRFLRRISSSSP
ncbi:Uncharacterised protein [Vibrio cholerae]|nr:Uncharacterised protein [Vibrio cholerae]